MHSRHSSLYRMARQCCLASTGIACAVQMEACWQSRSCGQPSNASSPSGAAKLHLQTAERPQRRAHAQSTAKTRRHQKQVPAVSQEYALYESEGCRGCLATAGRALRWCSSVFVSHTVKESSNPQNAGRFAALASAQYSSHTRLPALPGIWHAECCNNTTMLCAHTKWGDAAFAGAIARCHPRRLLSVQLQACSPVAAACRPRRPGHLRLQARHSAHVVFAVRRC